MRGQVARRVLAIILSASTALALSAGAAGAASIKPNQHFVGIVNGKPSSTSIPVVFVVCAGPISQGETGPVAGGQTLAVAHVSGGGGFTGPFRRIYAWFDQDASAGGPQQVTLVRYRSPVAISTKVRVPCSGTGQVMFSSCPYLAPCAAGWVPQQVTVLFENIAD